MGAVNAKKVLKQLNRLDIPVYIGEDAPLREEYIDARDTHGMDGLGESFLPEVSSGCEKQSAVDFLTEILEKEKISIIALGPMTNLAKVFSKKPELIQNVEELVSMGGNSQYPLTPDLRCTSVVQSSEAGSMIHAQDPSTMQIPL